MKLKVYPTHSAMRNAFRDATGDRKRTSTMSVFHDGVETHHICIACDADVDQLKGLEFTDFELCGTVDIAMHEFLRSRCRGGV